MRYNKTSLTFASLSLLFTLLAATPGIHAAYASTAAAPSFDEEIDDAGYEETARVVRVSLVGGDVSLRRAGSTEWEKATLNLPLVEGDRLATGAGARVEIQIDARNFVRLGEYATLDIVTLRDEGIALSLPEGTATLRLARFDNGREYFEIDAPGTTMAAEQKGSYRLDVAQSGNVRVTVGDGGRARLYSETSGFTLRDGRSAELVHSNSSEDGDWELSAARSSDDWDNWVRERESYLASRLRHDRRDRYYDNNVWGAEELDAYGDWVSTSEYGYVWRPHVTVINNYHDWAPYRYGTWRWVSPYGWTWVGDEPWGWAPYHHGRWVYVNNYWCWAPRGYAHYGRRSRWRPALVVFVSFGDNVCWYPLGYHHRDPRSNYFRRARNRAFDEWHRNNNPAYQRAVTTVSAREFGKGRARPAPKELSLRALMADPVKGTLPLRPVRPDPGAVGNNNNSQAPFSRERTKGDALFIRNPGKADESIADGRKTGAAARRPGLPLDEELRRGRIYNNREPRKIQKGDDDATRKGDDANMRKGGDGERGKGSGDERGKGRDIDDNGERGTGAVARPTRPIRFPDTRDGANGDPDGTTGVPAAKRQRSADPETGSRRARPDLDDRGRPERKVKPAERPNEENPEQPVYRPERPPRTEPREERPRPVERERPAPEVYRPRPQVREERKSQREESPEPRPERSEPREERSAPREERSAPREERPAPPPREERPAPPPPPREERRPDPPVEHRMPHKVKPDDPR
ncbi:MAG TPA: DUF6600 domain-containing protein [Pyrinomonadaceae bacterium]|nr:DUF6600 domain-containing protein [Pyrinomonadaceae bacterium]